MHVLEPQVEFPILYKPVSTSGSDPIFTTELRVAPKCGSCSTVKTESKTIERNN